MKINASMVGREIIKGMVSMAKTAIPTQPALMGAKSRNAKIRTKRADVARATIRIRSLFGNAPKLATFKANLNLRDIHNILFSTKGGNKPEP